MISKNTNFLIVGLGLIGGSYAMGLKAAGYHVSAIDINEESIQYALSSNIIDEGSVDNLNLIKKADFIISCLYPNTMIQWMHDNQQYFKPNVFITDVSGVKTNIVSKVQSFLRNDVEFCASHPMAGKEVSGVQYADPTIFHIANFIITPTEKNSPEAIETLKDFAHILKFHHISCLSCKKHDEMIGFVSQLTHVIAVSLMNTNDNSHLVEYTGDSFRDLTRIANINEVLWSELFFLNKTQLIQEIDDFTESITHLKKTLLNDDEKELKRLFKQATERRKQFNK